MRVLPVLDVRGGLAVRAVAGKRERYRPAASVLAPSAHPLDLARGFQDRLGLSELYLADLDAIEGRAAPARELYRRLRAAGSRLLVDAGIRDGGAAAALAGDGIEGIIAPLETLPDPEALGAILARAGPLRTIFSLDLLDGRPLGACEGWRHLPPLEIGRRALALGARRIVLLDLAAVGTGSGCPVLDLARGLRAFDAGAEIIAGGGIRGLSDLRQLEEAGVDAALAATALHDGSIGPAELETLKGCAPGS